ncbi:MAG: thymidine phosphorylase [Limnochordaceae bacterium]|nr:thymidine phosphorylase [Limnochordaceae bacterium]
MSMYELIRKKRNGGEHTEAELASLVAGITHGIIPTEQVSAWLMAVYFRGMTEKETALFTRLMAASGHTLDLTAIPGIKVDKHSSGGVGDKTTIALAPLVAACGLPVAKLSGRALGHTGGTLDKLESIPGLRVELSQAEFIAQVQGIGLAVASAGVDLAPADKILYALRDRTATVDSLPLIAASIMSKKLAAGADAFVLDVKVGRGAFLKQTEQALQLARTMTAIAARAGHPAVALVTDMNQPLGRAVGNAVEIAEVVDFLRGDGPADLQELVFALGREMLKLGRAAADDQAAQAQLERAWRSGAALERFQTWIQAQGGDPRVADSPWQVLSRAQHEVTVLAPASGYLAGVDGELLGLVLAHLGAGRMEPHARIDPAVGLWMEARIGDPVQAGQTVLARLWGNDRQRLEAAVTRLQPAWIVADVPPAHPPLVLARVPAPAS